MEQKSLFINFLEWLISWIMNFWNIHGERIIYLLLAVLGSVLIYKYIPDTLEEVKPIFYIAIGVCLNKARSPKEEQKT